MTSADSVRIRGTRRNLARYEAKNSRLDTHVCTAPDSMVMCRERTDSWRRQPEDEWGDSAAGANSCVRNRSVGQVLCPNRDRDCVQWRRKSLFCKAGCDNYCVRHQGWCGT